MDHIKVARASAPPARSPPRKLTCLQVENVSILHHGTAQLGTLHLTTHHLIFKRAPEAEVEGAKKQPTPSEIWIAYPIIATAYRYPPSASAPAHLRLRNRDFSFVQFRFESDRECRDVFDSIRALTVIKGIEKLYAFYYQPGAVEKRYNGWNIYNPLKEFERMGVGTDKCVGWRITDINKRYTVCHLTAQCLDVRKLTTTRCSSHLHIPPSSRFRRR